MLAPATPMIHSERQDRRKAQAPAGENELLSIRSQTELPAAAARRRRWSGSARVFAEHDPAAAAGGGEGGQRGFGADRDLAGTGGAAELFDAVGVHRGAQAAGAEIAA